MNKKTILHFVTHTLLLGLVMLPAKVMATDCLTQVNDLALFEHSKANGQLRFAIDSGPAVIKVTPQMSFNQYLSRTKALIERRNPRGNLPCPVTTPTTAILQLHATSVADLVAPFELPQSNSDKAILLLHGLTDSPFTFHYLAASLHQQGYSVRTVLLPGHGTAASDLTQVSIQDWQRHVAYAIEQTSEDFKQFAVLGYSTGAALALGYLEQQVPDNLNALALISPATEPHNKHAWLAQWLDYLPFVEWIDEDADLDFAKYESFPWHGATLAHQAMAPVQAMTALPNVATFVSFSDVDTTIDNQTTTKLLKQWQQHPSNTITPVQWLYSETQPQSNRPDVFIRRVASKRVLDMSHIGILQPPEHSYYGSNGPYRNCTSYHLDKAQFARCRLGENQVYGERHPANLKQPLPLARITFNPDYQDFVSALIDFFSTHGDGSH